MKYLFLSILRGEYIIGVKTEPKCVHIRILRGCFIQMPYTPHFSCWFSMHSFIFGIWWFFNNIFYAFIILYFLSNTLKTYKLYIFVWILCHVMFSCKCIKCIHIVQCLSEIKHTSSSNIYRLWWNIQVLPGFWDTQHKTVDSGHLGCSGTPERTSFSCLTLAEPPLTTSLRLSSPAA